MQAQKDLLERAVRDPALESRPRLLPEGGEKTMLPPLPLLHGICFGGGRTAHMCRRQKGRRASGFRQLDPQRQILDDRSCRKMGLCENLPGKGHSRPGKKRGPAHPLHSARTNEVLHHHRKAGHLSQGRCLPVGAQQVDRLDGPPSGHRAGGQPLDATLLQPAIRVEYDHHIGRARRSEMVAAVGQGVSLTPLRLRKALDDFGASGFGDGSGLVRAIVGHHEDMVRQGRDRPYRPHRLGDAGLFIMGRYQDRYSGLSRDALHFARLSAKAESDLRAEHDKRTCHSQQDAPGDDAEQNSHDAATVLANSAYRSAIRGQAKSRARASAAPRPVERARSRASVTPCRS